MLCTTCGFVKFAHFSLSYSNQMSQKFLGWRLASGNEELYFRHTWQTKLRSRVSKCQTTDCFKHALRSQSFNAYMQISIRTNKKECWCVPGWQSACCVMHTSRGWIGTTAITVCDSWSVGLFWCVHVSWVVAVVFCTPFVCMSYTSSCSVNWNGVLCGVW